MSNVFNDIEGTYTVFDGYGVLIKEADTEEGYSYKKPIIGAYRFVDGTGDDDPLCVAFPGFSLPKYFPVDIEQVITDPDTGIITFSVFDGDYTIRKLEENDGTWLSKDKKPQSIDTLSKLITEGETY